MSATRYQRTIAEKDQTIANLKEQIKLRDECASRAFLENKIKQLQSEINKLKAASKKSDATPLSD